MAPLGSADDGGTDDSQSAGAAARRDSHGGGATSGASGPTPAAPDHDVVEQRVGNSEPVPLTRKERRALALAVQLMRVDFERRYTKLWRQFFRQFGDELLRIWDEETPDQQTAPATQAADDYIPPRVDRWLDEDDVADAMARAARTMNRQALYLGGVVQTMAVEDFAGFPWSPESAALDRVMVDFGTENYRFAAETTRRQFTEAVYEGFRQSESWEEIRTRIVDEIGRMTESRAANIATTETTKLFNAGGAEFRKEFDVEWKQWVATFVNTRESHAKADGDIVRNEENFTVGSDSMPFPGQGSQAAENCNCNCYAVGLLSKAEGVR
jgi:hypothetical protein